jgi:hypothetical protein
MNIRDVLKAGTLYTSWLKDCIALYSSCMLQQRIWSPLALPSGATCGFRVNQCLVSASRNKGTVYRRSMSHSIRKTETMPSTWRFGSAVFTICRKWDNARPWFWLGLLCHIHTLYPNRKFEGLHCASCSLRCKMHFKLSSNPIIQKIATRN